MREFGTYQFDSFSEITSSKRIFYSDYVSSGIPFYRSKEIIELYKNRSVSNKLYISEEKFLEVSAKFGAPEEGDILLTSVGTLGIPYLVKKGDKFYFKDGNLTWIRKIDREKVLPEYIYTFLKSPYGKSKLDEITIGSTQPALTISGLKTLTLRIPSLIEQKAITSLLSSLDGKIDLLNDQNKTLESMAETLFRQWFILDDTGTQVNLDYIIDFNPKRKITKNQDATYLDMAGLSTDTFCARGYYKRPFSSGAKFVQQDTLLARITPCLENGKAAYIDFLDEEETGWGSTEFIVMRPKKGIHPLLSYIMCRNLDFKEYAESCMEGSTGRQRVNLDHLKKFNVNMPSASTLCMLNELLDSFGSKLINNSKQIDSLEKLRDTLLPKLMNGEVKVQYVEEAVASVA